MRIDEKHLLKKNAFYTRLLGSPSFGDMDTLLRDASDLNLHCAAPFHRLVVAEIELWEEIFSRTDRHYNCEHRSEILFVLSNLCYEIFSMEGVCHVDSIDFQGRMVLWIDADRDTTSTTQFQEKAIQVASVLESEYRLFVTFSISNWFTDLFQTFSIYQDTLNVLFYHRYLSEKKSAYSMLDTPVEAPPISLPQRCREENRLLHALQLGHMEELRNCIYEIYQNRFFESPPSLALIPQRKAAFAELLEVVVNELTHCYPDVIPNSRLVIHQMAISETGLGQLEILDNCVDMVIQSRDPGKTEPAPAWVETLKHYVQENYQDVNLSVYAAAEQVGLTPSYCTRVFRQYTGVSLMKYIQFQRVQAAISLLESGHTMVQVAEATGFTCTQTLRRTLKQYQI